MRARHTADRPYYTRKYMHALQTLQFAHNIRGQDESREWCYAKLAELGYRWDSEAGVWKMNSA